MKFNLAVIILLCTCSNIIAQTKKEKKNNTNAIKKHINYTGTEFKVIRTNKNARKITLSDFLLMNIRGVLSSNDSVLFDSYMNKPYDMPANEPTFKKDFLRLKQGDSAVFSVIADSLFQYSFGRELPTGIPKGDYINFTVSVLEVSSKEERVKLHESFEIKQREKNRDLGLKDSIERARFLRAFDSLKTTPSGLGYVRLVAGKGRQVVKGDKITVTYKGAFLDGRVFDESKEGQPAFTFEIGAGQVIPGWEEGLILMKEGDQFKFIIPWQLAYGPNGQGPIPPFSTLVFDVKLDKID